MEVSVANSLYHILIFSCTVQNNTLNIALFRIIIQELYFFVLMRMRKNGFSMNK